MESPTVATYPSAGGQCETQGASSTKGKCAGVVTNVYSRKTLEITKKGSTDFENKGLGVVYVRGKY